VKKILKFLAALILIFSLLLVAGCFVLGNKKPETQKQNSANVLADKMLNAVNYKAWNEIKLINWTFSNRNSYLWDKFNKQVIYTSGDVKVMLNLKDKTGTAYKNGSKVENDKAKKLLDKAYSNFCNDSWWLNPIVKVYDNGVERTVSKNPNELMVAYKSGGVTPGDSYLWKLDESGLPKSYLMWTKILPIKGIEVTFEDWIDLQNGAKIAQSHIINGLNFNVSISDLKIGNNYTDFGYDKNPFQNSNVKSNNTSKPNK